MKCIKCNADIEKSAQFCPYCGTKVENTSYCVKCGKSLDEGSDFCPYCGTKQGDDVEESVQVEKVAQPHDKPIHKSERDSNSNEELENASQSGESKRDSKRNLWIIIAIIGLFCIIGGYFTFSPSNNSTSINEISQRVTSIYNDVFNEQGSGDYDEKYCSKSYKALVKEFSEAYDNSTLIGEIVGPEGDHWTISPEVSKPTMKIINITKKSNTDAVAKIHIDFGNDDNTEDEYSGTDVELKLVFENGDWYIDDFIYYDSSERQEYLDGIKECKENKFQIDDSELGDCYKIGEVNCLSYKQMKYITKNQLSQGQIDLVASKINFSKQFNPRYKVYYYQGANEDNTFYIEIENDTYIFSCRSKIGDWDYIQSVCSDLLSEDSTAIALWSDGIHFKETHGNGYNKIKVEGHSSEGLFVSMSGTPNYFYVRMHK
jgi:RNA polymerase subunit RPABC4/transcription elongation factor Spt4